MNVGKINTLSNWLSFIRLLMALPFWLLLDNLNDNIAAILFLIVAGSATDFLDGYFARKYNQVTEFGKIIDPLADKIVIGVIVIKLYLLSLIPDYYFYLIIGRDVLIFLGGIIVSKKLGRVLPSNMLGKITVTIIGFVILFVILKIDQSSILFLSVYYLSVLLIISSFAGYVYRATIALNEMGKSND